jgi:hypothetical protein
MMKPTIHIFEDRWCFGDLENADDTMTPVEKEITELALKENCALAESNKEEIKNIEVYQRKRAIISRLNGPCILLFDLKYENPPLPILEELESLSTRLIPLKAGMKRPDGYQAPPTFRKPEEKLHGLYLILEAMKNANWYGHIRIVSGADGQAENPKIIKYLFERNQRQDVSFSYCTQDLMNDAIGEIEAAVAEFKKSQGSVRARLLPPTARRWFAVNNPVPTFMHHDWPEAKTDQENALIELTRYFSGLSGGNEGDVQRWLQTHIEAQTISKLWNNLKTVVGVGSLVHCADGNRFLWFPALAFVLSACCKTNGFAVLTGTTFPSGMPICENLSHENACVLMNAIIKCFSAVANGDGDKRQRGEPLVKRCETGGSHFTVTLDIPFQQLSTKLLELEKRIDDAETSGCCGPLLNVQRLLNASPPACLDVSSSNDGKTILAIKLRE